MYVVKKCVSNFVSIFGFDKRKSEEEREREREAGEWEGERNVREQVQRFLLLMANDMIMHLKHPL